MEDVKNHNIMTNATNYIDENQSFCGIKMRPFSFFKWIKRIYQRQFHLANSEEEL